MNSSHDTSSAGIELYALVRSGFVKKGTSLNAWCVHQGLSRQNVRKAFLGEWTGPKADAIKQRLMAAAGITEETRTDFTARPCPQAR